MSDTKRRLAIAQAFEPIEVDLWGEEFRTLEVTRKVELALEELDVKAAGAHARGATDEYVEHVAAMFDLRLENVKTVKSAPNASAVIKRAWKANKFSTARLLAFVDELAEAERPT